MESQTNQTKRFTFLEVFNTVGTLSSISGISVLWLKGQGSINWEVVVLAALAVPAIVGLAAALAWVLLLGYRAPAIAGSPLARIAYFGLGFPAITLVGLILILLANKTFISADWLWFFHA